MRRAALFSLASSLPLCAQSLVFNNPSYAPPSLPACGVDPFSVTQTITQPYTVYDFNNVAVNSGTLQATGTGWCAGESQYCYSANQPAPWFQAFQNPTSSGGWQIYINVNSVPPGGALPGGYFCKPATTTQSPTPPRNVPAPLCQPHCETVGPGPAPANCSPSPIEIDTRGEGFHLTDAAHGVAFRERPAGALTQMSWTDPGYHNAWLARPNPDGSVTSLAANLFGNLSPQPKSEDPNGYRALAYWAEQEGCGVVDYLDAQNCAAVWTKLRLWQDSNQDGIAQPEELHTLEELGVHRISLDFRESRWTDEYGNQFRYVAGIADADAPRDKRCYDVFLVTQ
jgi:hypothetical protein